MNKKVHEGNFLSYLIKTKRKSKAKFLEELKEEGGHGIGRSKLFGFCSSEEIPEKYKIFFAKRFNIEERSFELGEIISKKEDDLTEHFISYPLIHLGGQTYEVFLKKYFDAIENEVKQMKKSLLVVDYLKTDVARNRSEEKSSSANSREKKLYQTRYAQYLSLIKNKLIEEKKEGNIINYEREYQCPLSNSDVHKRIEENDSILYSIDLMNDSIIRHTQELYKKGINFELKLKTRPIQPISFLIIDDSTLILEQIRYTREGKSKPDSLLIYSKTNPLTSKLIKSIKHRFHDAASTKSIDLDIDVLIEQYTKLLHLSEEKLALDKTNTQLKERVQYTNKKLNILLERKR